MEFDFSNFQDWISMVFWKWKTLGLTEQRISQNVVSNFCGLDKLTLKRKSNLGKCLEDSFKIHHQTPHPSCTFLGWAC